MITIPIESVPTVASSDCLTPRLFAATAGTATTCENLLSETTLSASDNKKSLPEGNDQARVPLTPDRDSTLWCPYSNPTRAIRLRLKRRVRHELSVDRLGTDTGGCQASSNSSEFLSKYVGLCSKPIFEVVTVFAAPFLVIPIRSYAN